MPSDQPLDKWFTLLVDRVDKAVIEVAEETSEYGERIMQESIEEAGLGTTWKKARYKRGVRRTGSKNGRVWTGDMLEDIKAKVSRPQSAIAIAQAGWIGRYREYYGLQEAGFTHPDTGREIKGMFIMGDAEDLMLKFASDALGRKLRGL